MDAELSVKNERQIESNANEDIHKIIWNFTFDTTQILAQIILCVKK